LILSEKSLFSVSLVVPPCGTAEQVQQKTPNKNTLENTMKTNKDLNEILSTSFADVIGMEEAKRTARNNLAANFASRETPFPLRLESPVVLAPAGTGKTKLGLAWQQMMEKAGFETLAILPSVVRKLGGEWDELISFLTNDGARRSLFIDEAHELFASGRTVQLAKLGNLAMQALDGNRPDSQGVKFSDEITVQFHRANFQIILATNFPGKMPEALAGKSGRAKQIILPLYTEEESAQIAARMLENVGIRACEDSLRALGRVSRGSARPLEHLTAELRTLAILAEKSTVNKADILRAMINVGLFPMGFNSSEISVLQFLQSPSTQQTLAARFPHLDLPTLRGFFGHAFGNGLVAKTNGGFSLSDKGRRYFVDSKNAGFPVPALNK
jgi:Holliday junction resolvasome RuvABC ATP-dependent DNA helicase subunit